MFYNPAMASDRDLNVALVAAWRRLDPRPRRGWEMLSATGARGLRVLHEAGGFDELTLTEHDSEAFEVLRRNAVPYEGEGARPQLQDARRAPSPAGFDYVDLDPYGTPVPFLPAAVASVRPGGLLAVTATDTRVLAGAQGGVAERRYGGRPIRGRLGPESGLRLLLALIAKVAGEFGGGIVPRLAYVGDHHVRAYVSRTVGASEGDAPPVGRIDPATWTGPTVLGGAIYGPMWLGPLFDPEWVETMEVPSAPADLRRTARTIALLRGECRLRAPFYYESNVLARELHVAEPPSPTAMVEELVRRGHPTAPTHARPGAFRTEATHQEVVACVRALTH